MNTNERGFTLVEMIVSVALFSIVMLVAVGALLSLTGANKKAQALQSVMNNLNIALDGMVRNVRMGTSYHCGTGSFNGTNGSDDCPVSFGTEFSFKPFCDPSSCNPGTQPTTVYRFTCPTALDVNQNCSSGGYIERSQNSGGNPWVQMTAPEVSITSVRFFVVGTTIGDFVQPKVVMVVKGSAGGGSARAQSTFHIEATAVQRQLDL